MRKDLRRWFKVVLTGAAICLISLDAAVACRWRTRSAGACCAPVVCCPSTPLCDCESAGDVQDLSPLDKAPSADDAPSNAAPPAPAPDADAPARSEPTPPRPEEPAADAPATPSAPPAPQPRDNFDNLFPPATPAPATPAPATPAPAPATPPAPAPAPATDEDDPFAPAPPATRAPSEATSEPVPVDDDPFAPLPKQPAGAPVGATPSPTLEAARPAADPLANPFEISTQAALPVREWVDDSGYFRVRGRLIGLLDGQIRILKETGRTTTVPITRLSKGDQAYVQELVGRYGAELAAQFAAR